MPFVALAIGLSMLLPTQDVAKVEVRNRRPSKIVAQLKLGVLPPTVEAKADDEKGFIVFSGPEKDIKYLYQAVALFDIEPRKVRVEYSVNSPLDKVAYDGTVSVANNSAYTFGESDSGVKVEVMPRINDDDTITVFASYTFGLQNVSLVARVKPGEWIQVPMAHGKGEKAPVGTPTVKIKVTLPSK